MGDNRTPIGDEIADAGGTIGLALSGGGLKASLFHVGVLARLAELDLLRRIDVISAGGGGAVIAALYFLKLKQALEAEGDIGADRLFQIVAELEREVLEVLQSDLRTRLFENPFANLKRVKAAYSDVTRLGALLERHLFQKVWNGDHDRPIEMRELSIRPRGDGGFNPVTDNLNRYCKAPVLAINAANLVTGRPWRFDADGMGEPPAGPASRRLSHAPLLAKTPYRRLPKAYVGMPLGQAVAASMATPGLLQPLRLQQLYPEPERRSTFLDVPLGDGRLADALSTDALIERGCGRLIVSDASGFDAHVGGPTDRQKALQLANLEANRPGGVILIHMLREIEALEVKPLGPIDRGHVVKDRDDDEMTSYGVEQRMQKLIAGMRVDLDAPSEIEAMTLMADGYLIAMRAVQQHRQSGHAWTDDHLPAGRSWRFCAMIEPLRKPSKALVKHLKTAGLPAFRAQRLALSQALGSGLLAVAAAFTLIALAALWSALRPAAGADGLWLFGTMALLSLAAWLAGRHAADDRHGRLVAAPRGWIDRIEAVLIALPRALLARFRRHASRSFLQAGRLKTIGIEPVLPDKPAKQAPDTRETKPTATEQAA